MLATKLSTGLRPAHARHASLRPGFQPGFRPARLVECRLYCSNNFVVQLTMKPNYFSLFLNVSVIYMLSLLFLLVFVFRILDSGAITLCSPF